MVDDKRINLFGSSYSFSELKESTCDMSAIAGIKPYTLFDGPERGVFAVDVWTGSGLQYTVVPDRGMNICNFRYRGIPLDWTSGTKITSPFLYEFHGWNWLRSFHGGLVHTCGLSNVGEPCVDEKLDYDNRQFGGHGHISNTPAQELSWKTWEENNTLTMSVSGKCRIVSALEENLLLTRTVVSKLGGTGLLLRDKVTNIGFKSTSLLLLYHCNFGFPLLSGDTVLSIPADKAVGLDGNIVPGFQKLKNPTDLNEDTVIYPALNSNSVNITLFNPALGSSGLGVSIKYSRTELPYLTVWKHYQKRAYVIGIEPGTCRVEGRNAEIEKKRAVILDKDQSIQIDLEISVIEG